MEELLEDSKSYLGMTQYELLEDSKSYLGMTQYDTRSWVGWHHHMTLVGLAHLFVTLVQVRLKKMPELTLDRTVRLLEAALDEPHLRLARAIAPVEYHVRRNETARKSHAKTCRDGNLVTLLRGPAPLALVPALRAPDLRRPGLPHLQEGDRRPFFNMVNGWLALWFGVPGALRGRATVRPFRMFIGFGAGVTSGADHLTWTQYF